MKYKIINLDELNLEDSDLIKEREVWHNNQDHSRWVYFNKKENLYYKLWNETYIRKDNVKLGIDVGFYDRKLIPAFVGLIFYKDICRGYVMKPCDNHDNDYQSFYEMIKERTKDTKYFIYDFCKKHVVKYKDKFCLIDLEGVSSMSQFDEIFYDRNYASFADNNYSEYVSGLYTNR